MSEPQSADAEASPEPSAGEPGPGPGPSPARAPGARALETPAPAAGTIGETAVLIHTWRDEAGELQSDGVPGERPFDPEDPRALHGLAAVGRALGELHAAERFHGRLSPTAIAWGPVSWTLTLEQDPPSGEALRRSLAEAGDPLRATWVAPEVSPGGEPTPASDVYALAALAYRTHTKRPVLGNLHLGLAPNVAWRGVVLRALSPQPERRPDLDALVRALDPAQRRPASAESSTNPFVILLLLLGGMFVLSGGLGLVGFGLAVFGESGRLLLVGALTAILWLGGWGLERRYGNTGFALQLVANRLLWAVAGLGLAVLDAWDEGPWFVVSAAIFLLTYALACRRKSILFAVVAVPDAWITAFALGALLSTGSLTGATLYFSAVAVALIGVAALGQRLAGLRVGAPLWAGALAALWVSVALSLALVAGEAVWFGTLWLAVVLAAHGVPAALAPAPSRWIAVGDLLALLVWVPSTVALLQAEQLGFLQVTLLLGGGILIAAFRWPPVSGRPTLRLLTLVTGLASTCVGPASLCLYRCGGKSGWELLGEGLKSAGKVHETLWVYVAMVLGVASALVGMGFLFARDAERKLEYRLLEIAGALLFFGTFTVLSLARHTDTFYPLLILVGGSALLALGVVYKRAALTVVTVAAMIVNLWIQYFAKLSDYFPMWLLSLGFGLALLGCGLVYERKLKRDVLPQLGDWR